MSTEEVKQAIIALAGMTVVASITPTILASILEKIRNLNDSDKQSLIDLLESIKDEINKKQDSLVSGVNIKTINGESLVGDGNITILQGDGQEITPGTSNYEELTNKPSINGKLLVGNLLLKLSELTNDAGFIKKVEEDGKSGFSLEYLSNMISVKYGNATLFTLPLVDEEEAGLMDPTSYKQIDQLWQKVGLLGNLKFTAANVVAALNFLYDKIPTSSGGADLDEDSFSLSPSEDGGLELLYNEKRLVKFWVADAVDAGLMSAADKQVLDGLVDTADMLNKAILRNGDRLTLLENITTFTNENLDSLTQKVEEIEDNQTTVDEIKEALNDLPEGTVVNIGSDDIKVIDDDSDANLNVCDRNGNVLAEFKGGHIRTKNFDSRNFNESGFSSIKGKKVSILGDSISTYQGYLVSDKSGYSGASYSHRYPAGDINDVKKTWWWQFINETGAELTNLCAWSGSKVEGNSTETTTAYCGCSDKRINDVGFDGIAPDIIIVWIGINDYGDLKCSIGDFTDKSEIPTEGNQTTFSNAYALMLKKLRVKYPAARIYCCTLLDVKGFYANVPDKVYPEVNPNGTTVYDMNKSIKDIASIFGCDIIDVHSCGISYFNCSNYLFDNLHPNAAGAKLIKERIKNTILNTY